MKKQLMGVGAALALALAAGTANAQCSNYVVYPNGAAVLEGEVVFAGGECDDCTVAVNLPFSINLYGTAYNSVNVSSNGNIQMVTAGPAYTNDCNPASFGGPVIMPHWDDQWLGYAGSGLGYGIYTGITGSPGSQKFIIEWRGEYYDSGEPLQYQVWLHEGSSQIDFVYGTVGENGAEATIGITDGGVNSNYIGCNNGGIAAGTITTLSCSLPSNPTLSNDIASGVTGSPVFLSILGASGNNPPSSSLTVRGNLTAVGGAANQLFYDDGTHGDAAAGDGRFTYLAQIPHSPGQAAGVFNLPMTITDNLARTGSGVIRLTLTAELSGGCCTGGTCEVKTEYNCVQGGGTYNGNGSNCSFAGNPNAFSSISGTGTLLGVVSGCDDCTESVTLPFNFNFYGQDYGSMNVSSNGNVQFSTNDTSYFNDAIPTAAGPNNAIYIFWDDLNPGTQGDIYYQVAGTSPNQTMTVEWNNVSQYTAGGTYPVTSETFQLVLHEGSNNIEFRYAGITPARTDGLQNGTGLGPTGDDYTIGIEDVTGTMAAFVSGTGLGAGNTSLLVNSNVSVATCGPVCGTSDFNGDGDFGTDQDIEAFFACLGGVCCPTCFPGGSDFNGDGDYGTDQDIEAFFRVLAGSNC